MIEVKDQVDELKENLQILEEERIRQNQLVEKLTRHLYDMKNPTGRTFNLYLWKRNLMEQKKDIWLEHIAHTYYQHQLMRRSLQKWRSHIVSSYKRVIDLQSKVSESDEYIKAISDVTLKNILILDTSRALCADFDVSI